MKIAFRVDASFEIGTGHVIRCLQFADLLKKHGENSIFICRPHTGNMIDQIKSRGYACEIMPEETKSIDFSYQNYDQVKHASWLGCDWDTDASQTIKTLQHHNIYALIIDHFGIDEKWQKKVKDTYPLKLIVIDGQADRPHYCDLLIDPSYSKEGPDRWKKIVPHHCELYVGPQYHFFRKEFYQARLKRKNTIDPVRNILIAFGGIDKLNATGFVLQSVLPLDNANITYNVVAGSKNANINELKKIKNSYHNVKLFIQPSNFADIMAAADFCIGAGGAMVWELCYLGIPTILISVAYNQERQSQALGDEKAVIYMGTIEKITSHEMQKIVNWALNHPSQLECVGDTARSIVNGCPFEHQETLARRILTITKNVSIHNG